MQWLRSIPGLLCVALIGCMVACDSQVCAQVAPPPPPVVAAPAVATPVPEIDAGMIGSGLAILAGGLMILRSRFRSNTFVLCLALIGSMLVFASPVSAALPAAAAPAAATPAAVPEIDAGMIGSGLTILAGGLMILRSRFRTN